MPKTKKIPAPFCWDPAPFVLAPLLPDTRTPEQIAANQAARKAWNAAQQHKLLAGLTGEARLAKYNDLLGNFILTSQYDYIPE